MDLLRIAAAFAVVWLHAAAGPTQNPDWQSAEWWTGNVADALSRWCVPVFIMISGALLLSQPLEQDPWRFYRRRATRLLVPLVFWTAFYLLFKAYTDRNFTWEWAAFAVLAGNPYDHLWYLYMIVGLYAVAPFLRMIVVGCSPALLGAFVAGCFLLSTHESLRQHIAGAGPAWTFLPTFLPQIGYFVAGYWLHTHASRDRPMVLFLLAVAAAGVVAFATWALQPAIDGRAWGAMHAYQNVFVILMSLAVFRLGLSFELRRPGLRALVASLAPLTFGIYLVHLAWMYYLIRTRIGLWMNEPLIGIPALAGAVFVASAVTVAVLVRIPFLRATVR